MVDMLPALLTADPVDESMPPPVATLTYSSMGKFLACRRAWHLGDYLALTKVDEPVDGPLKFGSRIHLPLEWWGMGKIANPVDVWNELMQADYLRAESLGWDTKTLDKEAKMGHAMLSHLPDYLDESGFFAKYKIIAVEKKMKETLRVDLGEGKAVDIVYQGKSDLIAQNLLTGNYAIVDWKTTASLADSVLTAMSKSPQFPGYTMLGQLTYPSRIFEDALAIMLRKVMQTATANPPFYGYLAIPMSPAYLAHYVRRIRAVAADMVSVIQRLDAGADPDDVAYFQPSQMNCKSCMFRNPCDLMPTYPAGAADMLAQEYKQFDPLARYSTGQEVEIVLS